VDLDISANAVSVSDCVRSQPAYCMVVYRAWRYQML